MIISEGVSNRLIKILGQERTHKQQEYYGNVHCNSSSLTVKDKKKSGFDPPKYQGNNLPMT